MVNRDDEAIARQEANDTYQSITDLDSIADTMFVAITFLLAALATWTTFAYDRIHDVSILGEMFIILVIGCAGVIAGSVFFLAGSLSPRGFYGTSAGQKFIKHKWLIWRNDDPVNVDDYRKRRQKTETEAKLRTEFEEWLDEYDPGTSFNSRESFEFSRLFNYKFVARRKAHNLAYGVALLRIAITLLVVIILLSLLGPIAADSLVVQ